MSTISDLDWCMKLQPLPRHSPTPSKQPSRAEFTGHTDESYVSWRHLCVQFAGMHELNVADRKNHFVTVRDFDFDSVQLWAKITILILNSVIVTSINTATVLSQSSLSHLNCTRKQSIKYLALTHHFAKIMTCNMARDSCSNVAAKLTIKINQSNSAHTLTRQLLVTTCFGSTTSTSGSQMATLRMQLISNPWTLSHPTQQFPPLILHKKNYAAFSRWNYHFSFHGILKWVSAFKRMSNNNNTCEMWMTGEQQPTGRLTVQVGALGRVGSQPVLFYAHHINWINSCNGCVITTAIQTLSLL